MGRIILIILGALLLFLQWAAYQGTDYSFDWNMRDMGTITGSIGSFIGFNFFGILGLIFLIIAYIIDVKARKK
jgi:RimJ/RimL family protein N-acetyltransferase